MSLIQWQPVRDYLGLRDEFNSLFDTVYNSRLVQDAYPPVDFKETDEHYEIEAELPGVTKEDIKITVHGNILHLTGEKKQEPESAKKCYRCSEREYGSFSRTFVLPEQAEADKIESGYENGVLRITLPKAEEAKPKEIEIK